jgi:plasmid stability protein
MARLTVRNLDDNVMQWLRERGAARGVSMEQEARDILAAYVGMPTTEGFDYEGLVFDEDNQGEIAKAGQTKARS